MHPQECAGAYKLVLGFLTMKSIDLNADVGEGADHDSALMQLISSASIACGYHAGDAVSMRDTVSLAHQHGVAVGAHPSFPDREHFGRREIQLAPKELHECIVAQVRVLADIAASEGVRLRHVKPHGALYNMAARDKALADTVARAVYSVDPALLLYGLAGSVLLTAGERVGLRTVSEVFADRAYRPDGTLLPRDQPGSVLTLDSVVAVRAMSMARDGKINAVDGNTITVRADTICLHGDTPGAEALARAVRTTLIAAGIAIAAP